MEIIDGIKWDFGPNDKIDYFDNAKSYYITKYRPINATEGLDFDPAWFTEDGERKLRTGKYSSAIYGTKQYQDFWNERFNRAINGYESHGYRVTGDNYFWLNFFRLKSSVKGQKASSGRKLAFPMFLVFQYEYFHYVEMCELLGKDVALVKARGIGFSEMGAELAVRPFVTTPNYRVLASAPSEKHLKPLLAKIWPQLDWLNEETEGAFKRVRMVKNTDLHKRASKKKKDGTEFGHMAEIEGVVADSAEKIRGDRTERILYEEAGSDPVLKAKYIQGLALIEVLGGDRIGTRIVWGTGGDNKAVQGLKDIILNPDAYNILKFRHNYTPDNRYITTGYFIPAFRNVPQLVDSRGYSSIEEGKKVFEERRLGFASDPNGLLMYCAEYCFTIEEAFSQEGDNFFPREQLAEQLAAVEIYKTVPEPQRGNLVWDVDPKTDTRTGKVNWRPDKNGKVQILEHPLLSEDGQPFKHLYVGGIDSIDIGKSDTASTNENKLSDFCIVIKKRVFGQSEPLYVAMYKDRPLDIREAYDTAAKLLVYYFAQAVLEATRTTILTYFRDHKFLNLLMKRPRATMPDVSKGNSNMYGAPATTKTIDHYRNLIYSMCLDYSHTIAFREMLTQLLSYSDERKKEFDIVAALGMAELGDEELSLKKPEPREAQGQKFSDIGWFTDANGYKHYGPIPKNSKELYDRSRISPGDSWLYKDDVPGRLY